MTACWSRPTRRIWRPKPLARQAQRAVLCRRDGARCWPKRSASATPKSICGATISAPSSACRSTPTSSRWTGSAKGFPIAWKRRPAAIIRRSSSQGHRYDRPPIASPAPAAPSRSVRTQQHGDIISLGFRIGDVAYCSDISDFPRNGCRSLTGLDMLIIDALQYKLSSKPSVAGTVAGLDRSAEAEARHPHPYAHAARLRHRHGRDAGACRPGL
jgi:hypothetical protein